MKNTLLILELEADRVENQRNACIGEGGFIKSGQYDEMKGLSKDLEIVQNAVEYFKRKVGE